MGSLKGLQGTLRLEYRGALSIASYQINFFWRPCDEDPRSDQHKCEPNYYDGSFKCQLLGADSLDGNDEVISIYYILHFNWH